MNNDNTMMRMVNAGLYGLLLLPAVGLAAVVLGACWLIRWLRPAPAPRVESEGIVA